MALLEVHKLSVGIKAGRESPTIIDSIDLRINAGEIVAFIGESGCGKTLTALSIMRLLPPAAEIIGGEIFFHSPIPNKIDLCSASEKICAKSGEKTLP